MGRRGGSSSPVDAAQAMPCPYSPRGEHTQSARVGASFKPRGCRTHSYVTHFAVYAAAAEVLLDARARSYGTRASVVREFATRVFATAFSVPGARPQPG